MRENTIFKNKEFMKIYKNNYLLYFFQVNGNRPLLVKFNKYLIINLKINLNLIIKK